ncbi:MAG TPA: tetratricopeptide repeat protein [Phycisphaerae bacterium]|nr:tetratricopeptide repeat protein [Phycisphaerae bacterium]
MRAFALGMAVLLSVSGASGLCFGQTTRPVTPAPSTRPGIGAPALAGSSSCRDCHEPFYQKWATSHHGLAMQPLAAELAAGQLKPLKDPLVVRDRRYRVELDGSKAAVVESGPDGEHRYAIAHALGGKNVFYFLTPLDRGRLQVLPVAFDVRRREWFDTTASAARGIMNLHDEVLDWRAPQLTFNTSCYGCHVSQFSSNYDPQTDTYHSAWAEPGINCETCHAAGGDHVKLYRDLPAGQKPDNIRIISTKKFSVEQINALCAPCHAKSMPLTDSFRPGDRYFDNYDLAGPEQSDFYPDGRDLGENYTCTSWRMSPCVKSGKLSCMHCHTSSGRYRFADDTNKACLPCHQKYVENAAAHTHHKPDSTGNLCVACHMPATEFARMRRTDHSMRPPMPAATLAFKSPNACNPCHADHDASWSDKYVREWRSRDYQAPVLRVAMLVDAARRHDWARLPDMLAYIIDPERDEVFATALVRLLRACEDERKWPTLLKVLKDPSPLVRASAAESLDGYFTSDSVAALLAAAGDDYRLVRVRAAATLAALPPGDLPDKPRRDLERATNELLALSRARPDDSASQHNLGNFHAARREYDRAVACYERAFRLLPDNVAPLVNASLAYNAAGRNDKAEDCLRRALRVEPNNAAAILNLGLLLGEMERPREAEEALRAAFKVDSQSATAAYNLAVLVAQDRPEEAIEWCRKAARLRPQEPKYAYTLAFYLRQRGDADGAIVALRAVVDVDVPCLDAYLLLGQVYEEQGRRTEAIEVYRRAAENDKLPETVRARFTARAEAMSGR